MTKLKRLLSCKEVTEVKLSNSGKNLITTCQVVTPLTLGSGVSSFGHWYLCSWGKILVGPGIEGTVHSGQDIQRYLSQKIFRSFLFVSTLSSRQLSQTCAIVLQRSPEVCAPGNRIFSIHRDLFASISFIWLKVLITKKNINCLRHSTRSFRSNQRP